MEPVKTDITFDDYYKLDLRVAKIAWASRVSGADRLLKLTLDVGDLGQRVVVSPIGVDYEPADLLDKRVVYLANMKPKSVGGILSQGMVLTAFSRKPRSLDQVQVLLVPDRKVLLGSIVR